MTRGTRNSLIVVAVLVVAYPVAAWLIGLAAAHTWQTREQQLLERYPYIELVKRDYQRGVYSSTEEVTYRLSSSFLKGLQGIAGADVSDFKVTVRNTIHHGPLPQMRAFAPATVDTEIILPPNVQDKLVQLLGPHTGFVVHTRLNWLGGSTTVAHSPPFQQQTPDGAMLVSRGIDATSELGPDLKYHNTEATAAGLSAKSAKGSFEIDDLRLQAKQQLAFEDVYVGPFNLTVGRVDIAMTSPQERKIALQKVSIDSKSSVQGEYVDMDATFNADSLQVQQVSASHLIYEFRASHIHGPSLSAFTKSVQAAQSEGSGTPAYTAKMQEALKTNGVELLLHDPVIEMPHIGFAMPEGELSISLKASAQGLKREELDGPPMVLVGAFAKHVQASADLRIDTALLDKFLDSSGKGDKFALQLQGLQNQGYLKLDGKALTTHLTYQDGQLKVNGLSFPAVGPMPQPAPGH